ncbi:Alpha/Beta hydrolase protein [Mrakia frigida]|uniref:alpha/beta fold hydrolase n=1 Tax=Mrakia frigida TaxID=29902 RepID=UPI003FCBF837
MSTPLASHNSHHHHHKSVETTYQTVSLSDGVEMFWREASPHKDAPVILLLHGFPTSSFQYRNLIPKLSHKYRVIAPDLPGYGDTVAPGSYEFTFAALSQSLELFIDALGIKSFIFYAFDYGAPTGFRLALRRPELFKAIVTQNGNAYEEGLGEFWRQTGLRDVWEDPSSPEKRKKLENILTLESTKWQYTHNNPRIHLLAPESYNLAYLQLKSTIDAQISLFVSYASNVDLYPAFQEYLRKHQPPTLVVWGTGDDMIFPKAGGEAFAKDIKKENLVVAFNDGCHFALESHLDEISEKMLEFFHKFNL